MSLAIRQARCRSTHMCGSAGSLVFLVMAGSPFLTQKTLGALLAVLLIPSLVTARQSTDPLIGNCEINRDVAFLDIGNVRAKLANAGRHFWPGTEAVYEAPKGGGVNSEFVVSLIVGGRVGGEERVAGTSYGPEEFWPGPLDGDGSPPADCAPFNRVYSLERERDLVPLQRTGAVSQPLAEWPDELGTPFFEGGGGAGYDPVSGDRPAMFGDQMLWWVMNDRGNEHQRYLSEPLGLEVGVHAFAFGSTGSLGNVTFYRYRITNRNTEPIDDLYAGWYRDSDLGYFGDDYIGTDTTLGLAYSYNGLEEDREYGLAPPAAGFMILYPDDCAAGSQRDPCWNGKISSHMRFFDCCGTGSEPQSASEYRHWIEGRYTNGEPIQNSEYLGATAAPATTFMYPGDPVEGAWWSERNIDGRGTANMPGDRKSFAGSLHGTLAPGESVVLTIALLWSRGDSNLDSVRKLRSDAAFVRGITNVVAKPEPFAETRADVPTDLIAAVYPSPTRNEAVIRFTTPDRATVSIQVFDSLGRRFYRHQEDVGAASEHSIQLDTSGWAVGPYFVRFAIGSGMATRHLLVVR